MTSAGLGGNRVKFVLTAALRQELPSSLLEQARIPVVTPQGLASGALNLPSQGKITSAIAVVTGVGRERAMAAAEVISRLDPLFVLNLGSAGLASRTGDFVSMPLGTVIEPLRLLSLKGTPIRPSAELPVTLPRAQGASGSTFKEGIDATVVSCGTLISLERPLLSEEEGGHIPVSISSLPGPVLVDMEAAFSAQVFRQHHIPFYTLKVLTDACSSRQEFHANLHLVAKRFEEILAPILVPEGKISVVIPVRNRPAQVVRALESVLAQRRPAFEVVVVDDCSSDATVEGVRSRFGDKVRLLRLPRPSGVSVARNRGIEACRGDWIALLDSDDEWSAGFLDKMWKYRSENPLFEILQSDEIWIRKGVRVNRKRYHEKREGWIFDISLLRCMISPSAVMFRKALFERFGPFDPKFPACEDYDLWLRIARHVPVGLCNEPLLVKYGGHDDQLSRSVPVLDRYRVRALLAALQREGDGPKEMEIRDVLCRKLQILANGARKRGLVQEFQEYDSLHKAFCRGAMKGGTRRNHGGIG